MTETETEELHHAIAERFDENEIQEWGGIDLGIRFYHVLTHGECGVVIPDYRHPKHWARLQELLKIDVIYLHKDHKWLAEHWMYEGGECKEHGAFAHGVTQGEAIVACVVKLLKVEAD